VKHVLVVTAVAAALALIAACAKKEEPKVDAATEQKQALERAKQGPFGSQMKALDTSKGLGDEMNKKAQEEVENAEKAAK
jgi:CheY-like chemotaxis protein